MLHSHLRLIKPPIGTELCVSIIGYGRVEYKHQQKSSNGEHDLRDDEDADEEPAVSAFDKIRALVDSPGCWTVKRRSCIKSRTIHSGS